MLHRYPSFDFLVGFLQINRASFLVPDRPLLLGLKNVLDESCGGTLVGSSESEYQNLTTIQGLARVLRNSVRLAENFCPLVWSTLRARA